MAGLIETNIKNSALPKTATYDPEKVQVDEASDMVSGRIGSLLDDNSKYLQSARTRADQQMNTRGLLNSSMAVGASELAAYDAAFPIAQQDAATSFEAKALNQKAGNRAMEVGALGTQSLQQIGEQGRIEKGLIREKGKVEGGLIGLRRDAESELIAQRGEIEKELQSADAATRERLLQQQGEIDRELTSLRGSIEADLIAQRGEIEKELQSADAATRERLLQEQGEIDRALTELRGSIEEDLVRLRGRIETGLQELQGDQAEQLANIEAENRLLIQSSQSASLFYAQMAEAIGSILMQPEINTTNKQQLINKQMELLDSGLAVIGGVADLDLGSLLDFGGSGGTGTGSGGGGYTDYINDIIERYRPGGITY